MAATAEQRSGHRVEPGVARPRQGRVGGCDGVVGPALVQGGVDRLQLVGERAVGRVETVHRPAVCEPGSGGIATGIAEQVRGEPERRADLRLLATDASDGSKRR